MGIIQIIRFVSVIQNHLEKNLQNSSTALLYFQGRFVKAEFSQFAPLPVVDHTVKSSRIAFRNYQLKLKNERKMVRMIKKKKAEKLPNIQNIFFFSVFLHFGIFE